MSAGEEAAGTSRLGRDPFEVPPAERDPIRRLRGRLVAPVTVWTCPGPHALTVSSLLAVEGEPPELVGLLGPAGDFWAALSETRRFVVHVLGEGREQVALAERFAALEPLDPFDGLKVEASPDGPLLSGVATRAVCRLTGYSEVGWSVLVRATVEDVAIGRIDRGPLVLHRGAYRRLGTVDPG